MAVGDCTHTGAIAEMTADYPQLVQWLVQRFCCPQGDIVMRGAVETVTSQTTLAPRLRHCIGMGSGRHCLVESGIKYRHLRQRGPQCPALAYRSQCDRVVQRRPFATGVDGQFDTVINQGGAMKAGTAMHHTMADGIKCLMAVILQHRWHLFHRLSERSGMRTNGYLTGSFTAGARRQQAASGGKL